MRRMLVALLIVTIIGALWFFEEKAVNKICESMLGNIESLKAQDNSKELI